MAQRDLEEAEELLRKGRFGEATERFRVLLSEEPENPELRARCGEAYRLLGNAERAFHHYNKGAQIYQRTGDALNALRLLVFANSLSPNEPDILYRMAECKKALNDTRDLENILRQLITVARGTGDRRRLWALEELSLRHPEDLELQLRRAEALTESGRIDDALNAWKLVSARLDQRGIDFVPMLHRAAQVAPDRPDVGVDLANILLANRRTREALILLVPYYEKFPDDIGILETLLRALEAIGAQDKLVPTRIELIKARAKRNQREQAMKEIAVLLQAAPDDITALEVSAHAYNAFGVSAEAVPVWRKLAFAYDRTGRKYDRDRAILMLLKSNPDDEDALALGAHALRQAARNDEAEVLENRLALLRRIRTKNATPQRPPSLHAQEPEVRPTSEALPIRRIPSGLADTSPPRSRPAAAAITHPLLAKPKPPPLPGLGEETSDSDARAFSDAFASEEPTIPPEGMQAATLDPFTPGEMSEPSLERVPVAKNPWTEGLVLDSSGLQVPTLNARGRMVSESAPPPTLRDPDVDEPRETTPTRPLLSKAEEPTDDPWTDGFEMPLEAPASLEESTSRMADLVRDELAEIRAQFQEKTNETMPSDSSQRIRGLRRRSAPPEEFTDVEDMRPTARQKLVQDLKKL